MKHYKVKQYTRQAGMTLIELTVVLLVLIGLAGLMIPYVQGFVTKTHDSTGSSNLAQLGTALQRFELETGRNPDGLDSLVTGAGTAAGADIIGYTIAGKMTPGADAGVTTTKTNYALTAVDLTTAANSKLCGSLLKAGIDKVVDMDTGAKANFSATFNNSAAAAPIATIGTIAAGTGTCTGAVAEITAAKVASAFNLPTTATTNKRYVMFGVGALNEAVGKTMQDAPVHFAKDSNYNAAQAYNRFAVVYEVDKDSTVVPTTVAEGYAAASAARYVGPVMLMGNVTGLATELGAAYKNITNATN
jgi:type II secretory pathway pseudopilin PulG